MASTPAATVQSSDPPCRVLVRSKEKVELFVTPERANVESPKTSVQLISGPTTFQTLSPDGSAAFFLLTGHGVVKCPLDVLPTEPISKANTAPFLEGSSRVQMMDISPKGTFLFTYERHNAETCPENLKLWLASTGKLVASFPHQKAFRSEAWPNLQFTHDEQFGFLLVVNEVRIYPSAQFLEGTTEIRYEDKLRITGVSSVSLPRKGVVGRVTGGGYLMTSFCPGTKDKPARAGLHEYRPASGTTGSNAGGPKGFPARLSKSLFQAEEMKVHWSPSGDAALITLQTSVDTSGESYYGSSQLFLLADKNLDVVAVPLPQEGPVLSVQWMPNPDKQPPCFCVVAGKMPAMASLHHGGTGKALSLFGNAHRNTIAWAPHGRFVLLAGFGNLAGGMGFWDRNKMKLIQSVVNTSGDLRAEAVVGYDWSPDSRLLVVSTTSPRMRVDNGLRLYRYTGEGLLNVPWNNADYRPDKLSQVVFVPAPSLATYPDRPQSPMPERIPGSAAAGGATNAGAAAPAPKPAGKYVPPSARNRGAGGTSLAERMRKEREGNMQGATKNVINKPAVAKSATGRSIPGLVQQDPSAKTKTAQKREKVKAKKQQDEARKKQEEEQRKNEEEEALKQQQVEPVDPAKRARKIKKVLKQIDQLKEKDPGSLLDEQKAKMANEASLRAELQQLGIE